MDEETVEVVFEVRVKVVGWQVPAGLRVLNESSLMQMVLHAAQSGDSEDDDEYTRVQSIEVRRIQ